jgi:predicted DNA-binding antitoxin AbrB/MazE fold protein
MDPIVSTSVKAVYENGVFKPEEPVALKEKTRVQLVIDPTPSAEEDDDPTGWKAAEKFVGMWKGGSEDEAVGEDHDRYLYKQQYAHLKHYLRPLLASPEWEGLSRADKLRRFAEACKTQRPDLMDHWESMDRVATWAEALDVCTNAIRRERPGPK